MRSTTLERTEGLSPGCSETYTSLLHHHDREHAGLQAETKVAPAKWRFPMPTVNIVQFFLSIHHAIYGDKQRDVINDLM